MKRTALALAITEIKEVKRFWALLWIRLMALAQKQ